MQHIKKIYLYLVSTIAVVVFMIGAIMLLNMGLKTWIFTKADNNIYYSPACPTPAVKDVNGSSAAPYPDCDPAAQAQREQQDKDNRAAQKQRDASQALAMIIVAAPIWWFHWRLARREV